MERRHAEIDMQEVKQRGPGEGWESMVLSGERQTEIAVTIVCRLRLLLSDGVQ